jgi:hypothetical protein
MHLGKMTLRFWKWGSANEEVQRLTVEGDELLKFDHIPVLAILHRGDE